MKKIFYLLLLLLFANNINAQLRAFNDIFPNLDQNTKALAFKEFGYMKSSQKTSGFIIMGNEQISKLDPQIVNNVLQMKPGFLVESIMVLNENYGAVSLLDIYNALGNINDLRGRGYNSATNKKPVPLFVEASRIISNKQTTAIPDPAPAKTLPENETVYIKLKNVTFGNIYYRGEMSLIQNSLRYTLTNFRNISYFFIPIVKEEKFIAQLYFEPIQEGVLVYSIAGADISYFVASIIDIDSAISKRLNVIITWAIDGIKKSR